MNLITEPGDARKHRQTERQITERQAEPVEGVRQVGRWTQVYIGTS